MKYHYRQLYTVMAGAGRPTADYRGYTRRCRACVGAGHHKWTDVRLSTLCPECGAGRPVAVDCPVCDGRGWLADPAEEPETIGALLRAGEVPAGFAARSRAMRRL